jgi:hypothetical protein
MFSATTNKIAPFSSRPDATQSKAVLALNAKSPWGLTNGPKLSFGSHGVIEGVILPPAHNSLKAGTRFSQLG